MTDSPTHHVLSLGVADLAERNPLKPGGLAIQKLHDGNHLRVISLSIDAGATLSEHTAGHEVLIAVVDGLVRFDIGGQSHELAAGALIRRNADEPHEVYGIEPSRLLLSLMTDR